MGEQVLSAVGIEAAARALCAADYFRIEEPAKSDFIEQQWASYRSRAESAVRAYLMPAVRPTPCGGTS